MPKENVYAASFPYGETDQARSVAELSWSREGNYVQLATRCINVVDESPYLDADKPTLTAAEGWYIELDRQGINTLIRNLRRARDQAYGRDE